MIQRVEHIQAELETVPFLNWKVLLNAYVPGLEAGRTKIREVPRCITQAPRSGNREGRRVEPFGGSSVSDVIVPDNIYVLTGAPLAMVRGKPSFIVSVPEVCHPPTIAFATPFISEPSFLPLPTGSS